MSDQGGVTRESAQELLTSRVVDVSGAARILGLAGRTAVHYYVGRGIEPLARFGTGNVFWRADVEALRDRIARDRAAREAAARGEAW